jgi:hypothetical protein
MITKSQQSAMDLYAGMMGEAKMRINSIEYAISGLLGFHPVIIREFSYLQLRMLCELVALGCLVAHGDIPATRTNKLSKAYQADEILSALEHLHPDFYPHPFKQIAHPKYQQIIPAGTDFLTKKELMTLTRKSGEIVHRGNLRRLLKGPISAQYDHPDVRGWLAKIKLLLESHFIALTGGKGHFACLLHSRTANGAVQVAFLEKALPPLEILQSADHADPTK